MSDSKVVSLAPSKNDVPEILKEMVDRQEHFDAVIVIALKKDGTCYMLTSNSSGMEKSWMMQFANSCFIKSAAEQNYEV
jgi:hypothetical protein